LIATLSTPLCAPVIAATRLRAGNAASARGAAWQVAEAIATARAAGATELIVVRADLAFYAKTVIWACRRNQAHFSITARMDVKTRAACETTPEANWVDIKYPQAIWDEDDGRWISDAQTAQTTFTAFEGTRWQVTARLIARCVKRQNPQHHPGQGELFDQYRYHTVFTDSPFLLEQAEAQHRGHTVIEQVNADLITGPLAHLPSGRFPANNALLACAAIAHNANGVLHRTAMSVAWVAVVGVHFFGLAKIWHMRLYRWLAAAITVLGLAGFLIYTLGGRAR
jgi:hypothetical protein